MILEVVERKKPPVLVVEDERSIRVGICDVLAFHGFDPTGVEDGELGLAEGLEGRYVLAILDVMLPGLDGFELCERLRERHPSLAILMLTARGSEQDVLEGFSRGADDYVTKPFSVAQLMARVQALMRRALPPERRLLRLGPVLVDADALSARCDGRDVSLSQRDVELLEYLSRDPGRVASRAALLQDVWGYARVDGVETRCVDMHVAKLRRKLDQVAPGRGPGIIETVRGAGYRLGAP